MIFLSICQNFSVFRRAPPPPHQQIFEIFENVEFLYDHEELDIANGTVILSERSSFRKANNFYNLTQLKLSIFCYQCDRLLI